MLCRRQINSGSLKALLSIYWLFCAECVFPLMIAGQLGAS